VPSAADVLESHGFGGDRLLKLSRKIANDELRRRGAFLDHERMEDLVGFLALHGVRASLRYDDDRQHTSYGRDGGDPFASYIADVMCHRVTDWYRSKAEGHGDRRYGFDNRVVLGEMTYSEPGDAFERELELRRIKHGVDLDEAEAELGGGLSDEARLGLHYARLQVEGYPTRLVKNSTAGTLTRAGKSWEAARLELGDRGRRASHPPPATADEVETEPRRFGVVLDALCPPTDGMNHRQTLRDASRKRPRRQEMTELSLYDRLGGAFAIAAVVDHFSEAVVHNPIVGQTSENAALREWHTNNLGRLPGLKFMRTLWVCDIAGGPQQYAATKPGSTPLGLEEAHRELRISPAEFDEVAAELGRTLDSLKVPEREKEEVLAAFAAHKGEVTDGYS